MSGDVGIIQIREKDEMIAWPTFHPQQYFQGPMADCPLLVVGGWNSVSSFGLLLHATAATGE